MPLLKIGTRADLPVPGEAREFTVEGKAVCVANVDGQCSAMDNVCLHRGGPLGQGVIEKGKVVCPWHGWEFDPKTGQVGHNATVRMAVYQLHILGQDVFVDVQGAAERRNPDSGPEVV